MPDSIRSGRISGDGPAGMVEDLHRHLGVLLDEGEQLRVAGLDELAVQLRADQAAVLARQIVGLGDHHHVRAEQLERARPVLHLHLHDDVQQRLGERPGWPPCRSRNSRTRASRARSRRCRARCGPARRPPACGSSTRWRAPPCPRNAPGRAGRETCTSRALPPCQSPPTDAAACRSRNPRPAASTIRCPIRPPACRSRLRSRAGCRCRGPCRGSRPTHPPAASSSRPRAPARAAGRGLRCRSRPPASPGAGAAADRPADGCR